MIDGQLSSNFLPHKMNFLPHNKGHIAPQQPGATWAGTRRRTSFKVRARWRTFRPTARKRLGAGPPFAMNRRGGLGGLGRFW